MKTTYIISTLFLSVLIWTCDLMGDVDKVKPYYKLEDQTAIRNAQSAEQVLRGVYTLHITYEFNENDRLSTCTVCCGD